MASESQKRKYVSFECIVMVSIYMMNFCFKWWNLKRAAGNAQGCCVPVGAHLSSGYTHTHQLQISFLSSHNSLSLLPSMKHQTRNDSYKIRKERKERKKVIIHHLGRVWSKITKTITVGRKHVWLNCLCAVFTTYCLEDYTWVWENKKFGNCSLWLP